MSRFVNITAAASFEPGSITPAKCVRSRFQRRAWLASALRALRLVFPFGMDWNMQWRRS
jgi:hypothetical protein